MPFSVFHSILYAKLALASVSVSLSCEIVSDVPSATKNCALVFGARISSVGRIIQERQRRHRGWVICILLNSSLGRTKQMEKRLRKNVRLSLHFHSGDISGLICGLLTTTSSNHKQFNWESEAFGVYLVNISTINFCSIFHIFWSATCTYGRLVSNLNACSRFRVVFTECSLIKSAASASLPLFLSRNLLIWKSKHTEKCASAFAM